MRDGFVVLTALGRCGHWIGYSAFRPEGDPRKNEPPSAGYLLLFTKMVDTSGVNPKAIYEKCS